MKYDIDLIKTILSYNIDNVDFKDNVYINVEKNKVRTLLPSELIYLFHKSIKNELSLHTIFNKSWFYGK